MIDLGSNGLPLDVAQISRLTLKQVPQDFLTPLYFGRNSSREGLENTEPSIATCRFLLHVSDRREQHLQKVSGS